MTYDIQKIKMGRQPIYFVELDLTYCGNVYGSAPCTASGAAGLKCFNTQATCQDKANFTNTTKTYRFSSIRLDDLQQAGDAPTFPTVGGISTAPTQLTPAKGLGIRSTCSVQLTDHPWSDVGCDPYLSDRTYDADSNGSFWGKLLARHPFYEGRVMRVMTGYLADDGSYDASNFITRTYFIDTISGPGKNGKVTVKGKDALKFADSNRAQLPDQSKAVLVSDITAAATSFNITDSADDVKNAYDAGQAYIRIDDETMLITNLTGSNPTYTLTVTRAAMPSIYSGPMVAEEHEEDSTVQDCHEFTNDAINDIVEYLLDDVAGIDPSFLDTAGWQEVINFGIQNYLFSCLLTEPTGVSQLLKEITEHTILLWWDERAQLVKMDSILNRPPDYGPFTDEESIIADSVSVARSDKERVSQAWIVYGHRNPVLEMDELKNFNSVRVTADVDTEGANQYNERKVRRVWSRWLPRASTTVASEIANRLVNYYKETKKVISLTLDPKDDAAWTGNIVKVGTRQRQDQFGAVPLLDYRVLQVSEKLSAGDVKYSYILQSTDRDAARIGVITPDTNPEDEPNAFPDYADATETLKSRYAFICYDDRGDSEPGFLDETEPYEIQ